MDSNSGTCPANHEISEHPFLWIVPFGIGKRMCMGARLAQIEVAAIFVRFLQDWEIKLDPSSPEPIPTFKMGMIEPNPSPKYLFTPRA